MWQTSLPVQNRLKVHTYPKYPAQDLEELRAKKDALVDANTLQNLDVIAPKVAKTDVKKGA